MSKSNKTLAEWCKEQQATNHQDVGVTITTTGGNNIAHVATCPVCHNAAGCTCSGSIFSPPYLPPQWTITTPSLIGTTELSPEEKEELVRLKAEHELENKVIRKQEFKALHPDLRQFIVSFIVWEDIQEKLKKTTAGKSARLLELESRNVPFNWNISSSISNYINFTLFNVDCGLTKQELIDAHAEACIEEDLLNDDA